MLKVTHSRIRHALCAGLSILVTATSARAELGVREVDYPSTFENPLALFWLGAALMGFAAFIGGFVITLMRAAAKSDVSATIKGDSRFRVTNVGQGVVFMIVGTVMMIAAFLSIPKMARERHVDSVTTTEEFDPATGKLNKRTIGDLP